MSKHALPCSAGGGSLADLARQPDLRFGDDQVDDRTAARGVGGDAEQLLGGGVPDRNPEVRIGDHDGRRSLADHIRRHDFLDDAHGPSCAVSPWRSTLVPSRDRVNDEEGYAARMAIAPEDVRLYSSGPDVARAVSEPVLLALGARAGLDVGRLDELALALGIAIASAVPGPVTTDLRRAGGQRSVTVSPVAHDRLAGRRSAARGARCVGGRGR